MLSLEDHLKEISKGEDFRAVSIVERVAKLLPPPPCHVLDVGCGTGMMSEAMAKTGYEVTALDASEEMISMVQGKPGVKAVHGTVESLDLPNGFDCVICLDLLEHIEDDLKALTNMSKSLVSGGCLILTVPSYPSMCGPKDRHIGHYRRYNRDGLAALLCTLPFSRIEITYWNLLGFLPVWLATKRGTQVNEDFRYRHGLKNRFLRLWFKHVENRIEPPIGLTLIAKGYDKR